MVNFNWVCSHCGRAQVVIDAKYHADNQHIYIEDLACGTVSHGVQAIGCANEECKKLTLSFMLWEDRYVSGEHKLLSRANPILCKHIIPQGSTKPQPDYIPAPIIEDYREACLVKQDSPKAAATLARRCLQGMIRDFCEISRKTLFLELDELRRAVDDNRAPRGVTHESVEAIDQVRTVGNIGAHMEADINLIVPVDAGEAQILIELIEMLFDEWYVERFKRQARLAAIAELADAKKRLLAGETDPLNSGETLLEGGAAGLLTGKREP